MIDIKKFDKEYSTQFVEEMKYLQRNGIPYVFVKVLQLTNTQKAKDYLKFYQSFTQINREYLNRLTKGD